MLKIKIDGKNVQLKPLTLNDLIDLEAKMGKKLTSLKSEDMGMADIRYIVWLSVKKENKEITEEQVGESLIMGETDLGKIQFHLLGGSDTENPTG